MGNKGSSQAFAPESATPIVIGVGLSYAIYVKVSQKLFKKSQTELVNRLVFLYKKGVIKDGHI